MGGAGHALADKAKLGVVVHQLVLTGQYQTLPALGLCIEDGAFQQSGRHALTPVFRQCVDAEDHLPAALLVVSVGLRIEIVGQVGLVRHHAVHKADELFAVQHEPEVAAVIPQPLCKFLF